VTLKDVSRETLGACTQHIIRQVKVSRWSI